jgi:hypothetical protein
MADTNRCEQLRQEVRAAILEGLARRLRDRDQNQAHAELDKRMGDKRGCGDLGFDRDPCGDCVDCMHAQIVDGFANRWDEYLNLARAALSPGSSRDHSRAPRGSRSTPHFTLANGPQTRTSSQQLRSIAFVKHAGGDHI